MGFLTFDVTMMSRSLVFLCFVCSAVLLFVGKSACAKASGEDALAVASDFDLARHGRARGDQKRFRLGQGDPARFRTDKLGPHWSISPVAGGPTVELAALGAGRKGTPKLAHVGVDWSF